MSVLKWMCSASLVMGLMVFSIGCDSKTAAPPVENTDDPDITMPAEGEAPAANPMGDAPTEEAPAEEKTEE
ncbi:hypothetical protein [Bremerella alba]|uniref:Secreted protein n=1 Tax=Bremerella alba TaxID=980252 RepID=A0A7V8V794_9BACT|nr:hypothetical protein [Bremerella alba]MBA2116004.1 hypothetical protein [Bremerella alba]